MKTLLTVSIIIIFTAFTVAQQDSTTRLTKAVNITSSFSNYGYGVHFNPNLNLGLTRHEVSIGPSFLTFNYNNFNYELNDIELTGVHFCYKLYQYPKHKIVDFYFIFDFLYQRLKVNNMYWESYTENSFRGNIGYGFDIKFLKHLYINQSFGLGVLFIRQEGFGFGGIFKFGIGYQFK